MKIEDFLQENANLVDEYLEHHFLSLRKESSLVSPILYGVKGGKKIRASLTLATGLSYGIEKKYLLPVAGAIEMIHAFSLVHDDLPCMDNDDYRRGKPSMHRAFGEAMAVLVGDALLIEGLRLVAGNEELIKFGGEEKVLGMVNVILEALGIEGMVGGQVLDLEGEGREVSEEEVGKIYRQKTASFLTASILCGAIAGSAPSSEREVLKNFGMLLGECFQIKDDILDVTQEKEVLGKTPGKDKLQDKATLVKVKGVRDSEEIMKDKWEKATQLLSSLPRSFSLLLEIARFVVERKY
ncbi:MAG TPA: polyprenyl synthetase family protein [Candidatus Atribacteria bacterium]|nr:polyprenyl synthetase family protein [Candidatus Atribacteria bacterium]